MDADQQYVSAYDNFVSLLLRTAISLSLLLVFLSVVGARYQTFRMFFVMLSVVAGVGIVTAIIDAMSGDGTGASDGTGARDGASDGAGAGDGAVVNEGNNERNAM